MSRLDPRPQIHDSRIAALEDRQGSYYRKEELFSAYTGKGAALIKFENTSGFTAETVTDALNELKGVVDDHETRIAALEP